MAAAAAAIEKVESYGWISCFALSLSMIVAVNAAMGMSKRRSPLEKEVLLSVDAARRRRKVTD